MKNHYIYMVALLALLPVLVWRDFTPGNELRYLSIADEALRNGTFFTFTNHGIPYADKPPLYFWLLMFAKWILGKHAMWLLTFFSLIPAWVVVNIMNRWADTEISKEFQPVATWMMLTCGLFMAIAAYLRPDMLMCMFIVLALRTFYRMLKREGNLHKNAWLFPTYMFLGLLSKGPMAILVPLVSTFTFLAWTHRLRTFGRYWGWRTWTVLLLGCFVWFGGVYLEGGVSYLNNLLIHQTIDRAINSFHHQEPFYYYAVSIWYAMQPWALLVLGTVAVAFYKKQFHSELQKFFLTVFAAVFVLLSCISSKIEVYLLPAYPFLIYLATMQLSRFRWNHWLAFAVALPAVALVAATPLLIWMGGQPRTAYLDEGALYAAAGVLSVTGIFALNDLYYWKNVETSITKIAFGIYCGLFVGSFALPQLNTRIGYAQVCEEAEEAAKANNLSVYGTYNVHRAENMDVFLLQDVRFVTQEEIQSGTLNHMVLIFPTREQDLIRASYPNNVVHIVGKNGYVCL